MTSAPADLFLDLMPHTILVLDRLPADDYGEQGWDEDNPRTYRCLIDSTSTTVRTADGEEITVALTAYVNSTPMDSDVPIDIKQDAKVTLDPVPTGQVPTRPVKSIEHHYDETGVLHNMVLRFT